MICTACKQHSITVRWCLDCEARLCAACSVPHGDHAGVELRIPDPVSDAEVIDAIPALKARMQTNVNLNGSCSFFDQVLMPFLETAVTPAGYLAQPSDPRTTFIRSLLGLRRYGRHVDYFDRKAIFGCCLTPDAYNFSQGVLEPIAWKGRALLKSAHDMVIYQSLLSENKPQTIIEIGAGSGGSALWLSDKQRSLGIDGHVYSMDIRPLPSSQHVTHILGDCSKIETAFEGHEIDSWPHPWLVIEDAHVNVTGVLRFFDKYLQTGDYLAIEDSSEKACAIGRFLLDRRKEYRVDTRYTDLFGHNATTAFDSILRRH